MPAIAARQEFPTGDKPSPLSVSITSSHKELTRVISRCRSRERDNPTCRSERKKINVSIYQNETRKKFPRERIPFRTSRLKIRRRIVGKIPRFLLSIGFPDFRVHSTIIPETNAIFEKIRVMFLISNMILFAFLLPFSLSLSHTHTDIFTFTSMLN